MNLPDRIGDFRAVVTSHGLVTSKQPDSQAVQWCPLYTITGLFHEGDIVEYPEGYSIPGYHVIIKKDGTPHERGIGDIQAALGVIVNDLKVLDGTADYSQIPVKITVGYEADQNGGQKMVVKWLNHIDAAARKLETLDAAGVAALNNRFGSALRAIAPKPVATAAKPGLPPAKKLH